MEERKINKTEQPIPYEELMKGQRPCPEAKALLSQAPADRKRVIVVLADDPTGIQTVHDVCVYTKWDRETITGAFREEQRMFFILTNSRGLTASESREQHRTIAQNILAAAKESGRDYILISRGDSTLRGHWPMETETLRETLELGSKKRFDGEGDHWVAISSRTINFRTNEVSYNYFDPGTYHKEKGTQSGHRFQLRNKIWTAPAYNDMRYNMVNVRRNKK